MDRYSTTSAIVIHKKYFHESDLSVTLLTPNKGKIVALAKGARTIKSSRLSSLQLGNVIKAQLYQKNNYLWLSEAKTVSSFLKTDHRLVELNLLFYFLEILNYLIAENQHIDGVYQISLKIIESIKQNKLNLYIANEIEFIKVLGFGLPLEIQTALDKKDYKTTQKLIKQFFESIIEKPLKSNQLFK